MEQFRLIAFPPPLPTLLFLIVENFHFKEKQNQDSSICKTESNTLNMEII